MVLHKAEVTKHDTRTKFEVMFFQSLNIPVNIMKKTLIFYTKKNTKISSFDYKFESPMNKKKI